MKLKLPEQNAATADSASSHPRKLKKVLATLPNTNMGEMTKQTYQILRDLNRQTMPNKHRLENMEMLRLLARDIFNNLKKYFINRTLPLPDKSQKIVNLNQSLLQELIYGYEIIAYEAANRIDTKIDDKTLSIAICRAISYLSEMLLRSSEVYEPCPKNLWHEAHQLYVFAESRGITNSLIIDTEREQEKASIENSYKQILLFALARPIALRQRDSERVFKELFEWAKFVSLQHEVSENQVDKIFCIRIHEDSAPHYLGKADLAANISIRTLDVSKLVTHVNTLIAEQSKHKHVLAVGDMLPLETLTALASSWGENPKRNFSRADRYGHINVAIGLSLASKAIRNSDKKPKITLDATSGILRSSAERKHDPDFTLESISNSGKSNRYKTNIEMGTQESNAWDVAAKDRALNDAYEKKQQLDSEEQLKLRQENADSHWQVVNISAGGYCLRWNSDDTSKAQVGEIIALQELDANNHFVWHIGVIRWMQFTRENGLEIGVQVISPNVIDATAQRVNHPNETPFNCLMLPEIKTLKQPSSAILPAHAFNANDKLVVEILKNKLNITLGEVKEHTGCFTQFTYKNTEEDRRIKNQVKKQQATRNMDDFDELWSSL